MTAGPASSTLATWRGRRILGLLCAVAFLDFTDAFRAAGDLAAFGVNERKARDPLLPLGIFRTRGLLAANVLALGTVNSREDPMTAGHAVPADHDLLTL